MYPDNANYAITIMFDDNHKLIEWYFNIAKAVGSENGIPFENESLNAFKNGEITKDDFDLAYQTLYDIEMKYVRENWQWING